MPFRGFSEETIRFLFELGVHNEREWFHANKDRYLEHVQRNFTELVAGLGPKMLKIDPEFEITPAVSKTISRIYRDTRFSKDKTPYRNNIWISFRRKIADWKETPVYFFELFPDYYHYGMGFFVYTPVVREALRKNILLDKRVFLKTVSGLREKGGFAVAGEKFKRVKDKTADPVLREWYERKELYLVKRKKLDAALFSPKLIGTLYGEFLRLEGLYHYLWKAVP
jgi:uncharacterized protein (TIGR02453 family)